MLNDITGILVSYKNVKDTLITTPSSIIIFMFEFN